MTCICCKDIQPWTEDAFIQGLITDWWALPEGYQDLCDRCWGAMDRVTAYSSGRILIRDFDWHWRTIRQEDEIYGQDA